MASVFTDMMSSFAPYAEQQINSKIDFTVEQRPTAMIWTHITQKVTKRMHIKQEKWQNECTLNQKKWQKEHTLSNNQLSSKHIHNNTTVSTSRLIEDSDKV